MKVVEKWVAGFWNGHLKVAKGHFKETKKQLKREGGSHADAVDIALGFGHTFPRDTDLLHDTAEEALDALRLRKVQKIRDLRLDTRQVQDELNLIDGYEVQK